MCLVALGDGNVGVSRWLYEMAEIKGKETEREGRVLGIKRVWNPLVHSTSVRWRDSSRDEWLCVHGAPGRRDCPRTDAHASQSRSSTGSYTQRGWGAVTMGWRCLLATSLDSHRKLAACQTSNSDKIPGRQRDTAERLKIVLCPPDNIETRCQKLIRVTYSVSSTPELWTKICTHLLN